MKNKSTSMRLHGIVEKDIPILGRGWYIVDELNGQFHLHSDGVVRYGIFSHGRKAVAFWSTWKEAKAFFEEWKINDGGNDGGKDG